jgi:hypothetical protein
VRLLDFLKREDLTKGQMERIGRRLQKSGRRALPPLVRRLSNEHDRERLYRYTCMLDFFDATAWLDQLVALTIRRRDLVDDDRLPLLEILYDYGVDVSVPPFAPASLTGASINSFLDLCLKDDVSGLLRFMDRFIDSDEPLRNQLTRRLGGRADFGPQAAAILRMLAHFEYSEAAVLAVETLGRLRHPAALAVLKELHYTIVEGLDEQIARSIRRLGFTGINNPEQLPPMLSAAETLITAQSSPIDCYGIRTVWISWQLSEETSIALIMQISEEEGLLHAVCPVFNSIKEYDDYLDEVNAEEGILPVELPYIISLIRDAVHHTMEQGFYMPPAFYAALHLFGQADLRPEKYLPAFPVELLDNLVESLLSHLSECQSLLDEPFFEGWVFSDSLIYELVEAAVKNELGAVDDRVLLDKVVNDVVEPQKLGILRRLLLTADLMQKAGADSMLVQRVLAVGFSLVAAPAPLSSHPFIRALALDSIETARQSLAEGYDPRKYQIFDDEDWE